MASIISTSSATLSAQRTMAKSQATLQTSMTRLSSGMRINSAMDDAAGLAISTRMGAQIRGFDQATRGMEQGISMVQTANGSLGEITNLLTRQRELAVQASSSSDASLLQGLSDQMKDLNTSIDRIVGSTRFEGRMLLDGSLKDFQIPIDASGQKASLSISSTDSGEPAGFDSAALGLSGITLDSAQAGKGAVDTLDVAIKTVSELRASLGAMQNRVLATGLDTIKTITDNLSSARSRIVDTDFAVETANMTRGQILQQPGVAMLSQANQAPQALLSLLRG
jgi:flagellin